MRVQARDLQGRTYTLNLEANDSVLAAKVAVEKETGIPPDRQNLIYLGKRLTDDIQLNQYGISGGSTLHINGPKDQQFHTRTQQASITGPANLPIYGSTKLDDSFDDDEHILNPDAYFKKLKALERETFEGSAIFRAEGNDKSEAHTLKAEHFRDLSADIPGDLRGFLEMITVAQSPPSLASIVGESQLEQWWQQNETIMVTLCQSYFTICRILQRFRILQQSNFSTSYFSLLRLREESKENDVAEIMRLRASLIERIKLGMEAAIRHIEDGMKDENYEASFRQYIEIPCILLLNDAGVVLAEGSPRNTQSILTLCHTTAKLLDLALISYVGSHGSPFCAEYLHQESQMIEFQGKSEDDFSFRCSMQPLACLRGFLDKGAAWVFQFSSGQRLPPQLGQSAGLPILTRMEDFADIWGPVWTIPAASGLIERYHVSKGVICRVESRRNALNAIHCHWYSRESFHRRRVSKLLTRSKDLLLAEDDLLLIGEVFRENHSCHYTLGDYETEHGNSMGILGTTPSYWRADGRSLAFGLSKIVGITVSGSQKLIPQTSLKQHILDKWTKNAARANPGVLNQYLGVEISNCTGNARRISLKSLLLLRAIWPLLERQIPQWTGTPWGSSFLAALGNIGDPKAIYDVWMEFPENRVQMADLVCCVLEVLDTTGRRENNFVAGFLCNGHESSLSLNYRQNDWARLLMDTHMTCVYAVLNEVCLECQLPNHSAMTCTSLDGHTVFQTELSFVRDPGNDYRMLSIDRKLYERADSGSNRVSLFKAKSRDFSLRSRISGIEAFEERNQPGSRLCKGIYIRASLPSRRGRRPPKRSNVVVEGLTGERTTRNTSPPDLEPEHAPGLDPADPRDRSRRPRRHLSSSASSYPRHPAGLAEEHNPAARARRPFQDIRNYAAEDWEPIEEAHDDIRSCANEQHETVNGAHGLIHDIRNYAVEDQDAMVGAHRIVHDIRNYATEDFEPVAEVEDFEPVATAEAHEPVNDSINDAVENREPVDEAPELMYDIRNYAFRKHRRRHRRH